MKKIIYSMLALALSVGVFTSCEDVPAPYENPNNSSSQDTTKTVTPTGDGTQANPYNVIAALDTIKALTANVDTAEIYVKGKIVSISEIDSTNYGNATYYISDDGTKSNQLYIYRSKDLGNKKFTSASIKVGDEVVVYGKFVNYKGNTPETAPNKSYLYSVNGKTSAETPAPPTNLAGTGTQKDPYNVAAALKMIKELGADVNSAENIYVKGKVVSVKEINVTYGNATYYISDDGTTTNQLYIFRSLGLNNEKFTSADAIKAGDDVIVCGQWVNYKGNTPETVPNKSYLYSVNGKTSAETPEPPSTSEAITIGTDVVTLANTSATEGTEQIAVNLSTLGFSNQQDMTTISLTDGTTITFDKNGETNGPKYYDGTKGIRVYKNNKIIFTGYKTIAKIVMTCDVYNEVSYVGNTTATLVTEGNAMTYTNVFTGTSGGGTQLRVKTITITYAQ